MFTWVVMLGVNLKSAQAQPIYDWSDKQVTIGWKNPTFDRELEYDPITSVGYLQGDWPLNETLYMRGELSVIHYQRPDNQATLFGNPQVGIATLRDRSLAFNFDVTFPVVKDTTGEAGWVGSRIYYPDRSRYYHETWTLEAGTRYRKSWRQNLYAVVQGELKTIASEQFSYTDFYLDYMVGLEYRERQIHYDLSLQGGTLLTGSSGSFGDRRGMLIQVGAGYKTALVDPRLQVTLPVSKDLANDLQFIMGLSMTVDLQKLRWPGSY